MNNLPTRNFTGYIPPSGRRRVGWTFSGEMVDVERLKRERPEEYEKFMRDLWQPVIDAALKKLPAGFLEALDRLRAEQPAEYKEITKKMMEVIYESVFHVKKENPA